MPRKLRQLRGELAHAGFREAPKRGKGSHTWWEHPIGVTVNLAGQDGDDAKSYMEKQVRAAIQ
ncbi:MAG TPA: type II toxin-antitoxin system HicA family toxin, partial [Ktedonobacterales bacterium]|nr:type II toxin-antitoxin system HicA family toxin [Ktedonobacterales bacterium]